MLTLFYLTEKLPIMFKADIISYIFAAVTLIVWMLCGIFSFSYFKGDRKWKRYTVFYVLVLLVLLCLDFSGNMITFYLFYEMMTLLSVPLVFHTETREARMAGLKYLFYSLSGAYLVLFGFYFVYQNAATITFTEGGVLKQAFASGNGGMLLIAAFCMILGFSVKAGMFPMHAWLPTAHPVAPAPASAFLSGIIVKSGVLGMIRVIFYLFGAEVIRGTWVQTVMLILSLFTVFMGSMLAYREKILKKRLAYSTVSQVSYIIFGLMILNPIAFTGAVLHVVFHAIVKSCLFLCAGAIIHETGKIRTDELLGIGKEMPLTLWCFTFASLSLVGIPPFTGFVSKWNLCVGAMAENVPVFSILGPIILLVSALLTAGYLLPIVIRGFLPGVTYIHENEAAEGVRIAKRKTSLFMLIPLVILALLTVIPGIFPGGIISVLSELAAGLM